MEKKNIVILFSHIRKYYKRYYMAIVSVKVPEDIKKKMKELDINWSEEIRNFIKKKIKEKILKEVREMLKGVKVSEDTSASIVREDRDSH